MDARDPRSSFSNADSLVNRPPIANFNPGLWVLLAVMVFGVASEAPAAAKAKTYTSKFANAVVFLDQNKNGAYDSAEPHSQTRGDGRFEVPKGKARMYLTGGTEIATGKPNSRLLTLPKEAKAITTLTALMQALLDRGLGRVKAGKLLNLPAKATIANLIAAPISETKPGSKGQSLIKRDAQWDTLLSFIKSLAGSAVQVKKFPEDAALGALADALRGLGLKTVNVADAATVKSVLVSAYQKLGVTLTDDEVSVIAVAASSINQRIESAPATLQQSEQIRSNAAEVIAGGRFSTLTANYTGDGLLQQFAGAIFDPTPTPTPTPVPTPTPTPVPLVPLNDTGITGCANGTFNNLTCPVTTHPGQDAESGRDVTHNDDSDGRAGFSFTKIAADGSSLALAATDWSCVQDNVSGLIWEVKTGDGGLRDKDKTYTNYSAAYDPAGRYGTSTDLAGFVGAVNAQGLCGAHDWRAPTVEELQSVVDYGFPYPGPMLDPEFFPNTSQRSMVWTSTPNAAYPDNAWYVDFGTGWIKLELRSVPLAARLVRSVPK